MKEAKRVKYLYSFYDVEMMMWTEPVMLRNDAEAKKLFQSLLEKNQFNDCPVEMYCVAEICIDNPVTFSPVYMTAYRRIVAEATVDDEVDNE